MLTLAQRRTLLNVARQAILAAVCGRPEPDLPTDDEALRRVQGAFVTLHKDGHLRGCIGYIEGVKPLVETVAEMAVSAATGDPRFDPVTCDEMPRIELEISVLSPLQPVSDPSQVEVGRHGLVVSQGMRRGLLLPQVPVEWGWSHDEFLAHTCQKAGLPPDAWRDPQTTLEVFEAEVFGEAEDDQAAD